MKIEPATITLTEKEFLSLMTMVGNMRDSDILTFLRSDVAKLNTITKLYRDYFDSELNTRRIVNG